MKYCFILGSRPRIYCNINIKHTYCKGQWSHVCVNSFYHMSSNWWWGSISTLTHLRNGAFFFFFKHVSEDAGYISVLVDAMGNMLGSPSKGIAISFYYSMCVKGSQLGTFCP